MAFKVSIAGEKEHTVVTLSDDSSETSADIFAFGALLNAFKVKHSHELLNVIDGFSNVDEAINTIAPLFRSAKLSPFVCRVKNEKYHFGEQTHHLKKYSLGKHAIHGLVYDAVFSVVETEENDEHACVRLQYVYDNQQEGYPFCYRIEVDYKLEKNNKLTISSTVTNVDETLMPVADGWHPYFTLGDKVDDCQLEFQSKEMLQFDEELIPTGKLIPYQEFGSLKKLDDTKFDNCFTVNFAECQPLCVFRNPNKKIQVEIYPTHSYPYLQIFTPDDRRSIAIENLSSAPDSFNNAMGLKVLEPHQSATFTTSFVITLLQ